jgi:methenyltetrahydrofolate cyclohydrolase
VAKENELNQSVDEMTSMTLSSFLEKLSSEEPVPGGGSVAALSGALGAALIAMYCRIGLHNKNLSDEAKAILQDATARASEFQAQLAVMITEDSRAFGQVMASFKLPKTTDEEKKARQSAIQSAFRKAVEAPMETLRMCVESMSLIPRVGPHGNASAFSDLKVAQYMCKAGAKGALENIMINLPSIKDGKFLSEVESKINELKRGLKMVEKQEIKEPA